MTDLLKYAQDHIVSMMTDLEGDDDFMPFMTVRHARTNEVCYVGIMMPQDDDQKDMVADVMTAVCAIHRTNEAVFCCTSYMVSARADDPEDLARAESTRPRDHPDRVEVVFAHEATPDGDRFVTAPVIRRNNGVVLDGWSEEKRGQNNRGRFGDAIHMGIRMGAEFPPEMCDYVDSKMAAGEVDEVIASFLKATTTARAEAATTNENGENDDVLG